MKDKLIAWWAAKGAPFATGYWNDIGDSAKYHFATFLLGIFGGLATRLFW